MHGSLPPSPPEGAVEMLSYRHGLTARGGGKQRGQAGEFRVFGTKCEFGGLSFGTGGSS